MLVVCGDDKTLASLRAALKSAGAPVYTCAADIDCALAVADPSGTDVCLLDARTCKRPAEAVEALVVRLPRRRVVVISADPDEEELVSALRAGASGYLPATIDGDQLVGALLDVLAGVPAIPRRFVARLLDELRV